MTVLKLTGKTDAGGELHLDTGKPNSKVDITLVIDDSQLPDEKTQKEWENFVRRTAGSITNPTFRRHPQGAFPVRER